MDLADLIAQAAQEPNRNKRNQFLKNNLPEEMSVGDLLWVGLRSGHFDLSDTDDWWLLARATRYTVDDLVALFNKIDGTATDGKLRRSHEMTNFAYYLTLFQNFAQKLGWKELAARHSELSGYAGTMVRYLLAHQGHLDHAAVSRTLLPIVAETVVKCSGDAHRQDSLKRHFSRCGELWGEGAWIAALQGAIERVLCTQSHYFKTFRHLEAAFDAYSDEDFFELILLIAEERVVNETILQIRARGPEFRPRLIKKVETWLPSPDNAPVYPLSILLTALMHLNAEVGDPPLDTRFEPLLPRAIGLSDGGPMLQTMGMLPIERIEALMFPRGYGTPYEYYHLCPTPKIMDALVSTVQGLSAKPSWDGTHKAPAAIRKIGAPIRGRVHEALRVGGGLHRHLLIRCLEDIGDASSIPLLFDLLHDTGPRIVDSNSNVGQRSDRVHDIPEIAGKALITLARRLPTDALLPALITKLASPERDIRDTAGRILYTLPLTAPVVDAARTAAAREDDRYLRQRLNHIIVRADVPAGLVKLRAAAAALPQDVKDATDEMLKDAYTDATVDAYWQAHGHHGLALLGLLTEKMRPILLDGQYLSKLGQAWQKLLPRCKDDPVALPLILSILDVTVSDNKYLAWGLINNIQEDFPALPLAFFARCTEEARPPSWRVVFILSLQEGWRVDHLLIDGLTDDDKETREAAQERLRERSADNLKHVWPLLFHRSQDRRREAVELIGHFKGDEASLPHLLAAQKKERAKKVKAALEEALSAYTAKQIAAAPVIQPPKKKRKPRKKANKPAVKPTMRKIWSDWLAHTDLTAPSREIWTQLTSHVEQNPPNAPEIEKLQEVLAAWPDALRTAPIGWLAAAARKKQPPLHWALARAVHFSRFGSEGSMTPARLRWIFTSPHMAHITSLYFQGITHTKPREVILDLLPGSVHLAGLKDLSFSICWMGGGLMDRLAEATHLTRLTELNIERNWGGREGVANPLLQVLTLPHLASLKKIYADHDGVAAVLKKMHGGDAGLPNLREIISASYTWQTPPALTYVHAIDRPWTRVGLSESGMTDEIAEKFAASKYMTDLEYLSFRGKPGLKGVQSLLRLPRLKTLSMGHSRLSEADLQTLSAHPKIPTMKRIHVKADGVDKALSVTNPA
ncbi:MAG: hypothetical protein AAFV53_03265 [Myxococcota bacterium]